MKVLGLETSCDETAAAVVEDGRKLLSNVVASSVDLHAAYGGVVPEIAARSHLEVILPVIDEALKPLGDGWDEIDAIAVTKGPGLSGSLLIGVMTARTLAIAKNMPLYGVNHVLAHVYGAFIDRTPPFPLLALIVSGGHTQLVLFKNHFDYKVLGQTSDDAVGEAFDKVAKMLGLPYPGGPSVAKAAESGNPTSVKLPKAKLDSPYNFSFSGLKTAVLREAQKMTGGDYTLPSTELPKLLSDSQKADIAASFQAVAIETLTDSLQIAKEEFAPASIVITGGVAANQALRIKALEVAKDIIFPDIKLCTDNGAMIAVLGHYQMASQQRPVDPHSLDISPSLAM